MIDQQKQIYEFGEFRLDVMRRQLTRAGEVVPLYSKAFDLLLVLVQNRGRDLTKDELLETVWPGQLLEEANLTVNMSAVRKALGEKATQPRFIVTIPGRGYRFVGNVGEAGESEVGLVIESQAVAQITVEQESETDEDDAIPVPRHSTFLERKDTESLADAGASNFARTEQKQLAAPARPTQNLFRRPLVLAGLILSAAVLVIASVLTVRELRNSRTGARRFQQIKLRQLTNDGRVINAAISPDGKFYVFSNAQKGTMSLRLGSIDGEAPIELRPPADVVYRGVQFAPDGTSVYYVIAENGRNILYRVPTLGGVPVKMRDDFAPYFTIAPDNKRVAFLRSDDNSKTNSVLTSNLDGSNERSLLTVPFNRNLTPYCISWSPDGSAIAVGASPQGNPTAVGLFILRAEGGDLKPLTIPRWREIGRIDWLKDGSGIMAIAADVGTREARQIWLVDYPSGETRRITSDLSSYDLVLSVASDSNNLLTTAHQQITNVWLAPVNDLMRARQLTFGSLNRGDGLLGLDWTPNGRIIYTSANGQSQTIWIMDADGGNARELTPSGSSDTTPSATGDGRFVVFDSERSGGSEIWRVNIDGSNPKQLTTCGQNSEPSVSRDGRWVIYKSTCDSVGALWRVSIDGGEAKRLTENEAWWPWVSPDSKWIACEYASDPRQSKLAIIPIEGGPPARVFDIPPQANFRYAIRWTADGKAVTYRDWGKGLWRQAIDGGPPQLVQGLPDEKIYSNGWSRDGKFFAFTRGVEFRDVVLISNSK